MELRQIQYFCAVVEAGSFTRAAENSLVSQSAISQQVKALEAELG
ncbi:MAG: LysR family transcriptional regulator, partial [Atopobiaceae bacterium]|nr:LysR family transcriptional regulator [Atopobiaceae bacterium]